MPEGYPNQADRTPRCRRSAACRPPGL